MAIRCLPLLRRAPLLSPQPPPFFHFSSLSTSINQPKFKPSFTRCCASIEESAPSTLTQSEIPTLRRNSNWKPMCLYYTQGKCTMMDDSLHVEKFCHSCSIELRDGVPELKNLREQKFDYFLVLDLEGKVEILEFPVLLFDAKTLDVVDVFHRFVRPTKMSEKRINEYIEGKYGAFGVDRVWHDTAITFPEVIEQFESWLRVERNEGSRLWTEEGDGRLNGAAFVTCGNWDLKTKVPQQCEVAGMELPLYFMEWINLKDIYLNFYNRRAPGMLSMMRELRLKPLGSHHLGIDDSKNIARVLQHMLTDGAFMQITAKRTHSSPSAVRFLFQNRI
ncbi:hypothetical protein AAHA92_30212 [Salvia divinorum]|uniref:Exonuclease domain-containing protein n=1 Tax=Salvia divinorum TaxID=28513 RepID=A0ABD1G0W2_SALDI